MIPYTVDRREDTGVTNVTMGIWLFLASEVMLFGSLFSAYALLRVGAATWSAAPFSLDIAPALVNTVAVIGAAAVAWRARVSVTATAGRWLLVGVLFGAVFIAVQYVEYRAAIARGMVPAVSTFIAMYFTLTALHALHVAGGALANIWVSAGVNRADARLTAGRLRALSLYWTFVNVVWVAILALVYFA